MRSWIGPAHNPSLIEDREPKPVMQPPPRRAMPRSPTRAAVIAVSESPERANLTRLCGHYQARQSGRIGLAFGWYSKQQDDPRKPQRSCVAGDSGDRGHQFAPAADKVDRRRATARHEWKRPRRFPRSRRRGRRSFRGWLRSILPADSSEFRERRRAAAIFSVGMVRLPARFGL